jgi:large subunit ribosomal protein L37e
MGSATGSMGKKSKGRALVQRCRRCGKRSYHVRNKKCASCGYGATAKLRTYKWQTKKHGKTRIRPKN